MMAADRILCAAWAAALLSGCAPAVAPPPAGPPPPEPPAVATPAEPPADTALRVRHAVRPLPYTNAFRHAVQARTRTMDGRPGPGYWTQAASYRIEAELDPATARLDGRLSVVYTNHSPDTLRLLVFHLHQNVFAPGSERVRPVPVTGGKTVTRLVLDGVPVRPAVRGAAPPAYDIDGTLMRVELPAPLPPGGAVTAEVDWHFTVPPAGAPRTGHDGHEAFAVAQWYPQIANYDDLVGWHVRPYWGNAEFYLMYADFDVAITLPEGWLVAATGTLDNADEVLTDAARERLAQARVRDDVVHIVDADEMESGAATQRSPGGQLTWRFSAGDVRDFAFSTSDRYLWDATRALAPAARGGGALDTIAIHALYRPEAVHWRAAAIMNRDALLFHARWHPYIYPQLSAAEGPVGGMEYPMLSFISARTGERDLFRVTTHEVAHQWFPMMVGSNETEHMWQDEGIVTWAEDLHALHRYGDAGGFRLTQDQYLGIAGSDFERPIVREGDLYGIGSQYGVASYFKPATLFLALGRIIGEETLHQAIAEYARRWLLRHPAPFDLFHTIEDVAGRDLTWFWTPWFYDTAFLDHAIVAVEAEELPGGRERVVITIEDLGSAPMPVELEITAADGSTVRAWLPVEPWLEGRVRQQATVELDARVARVVIDPDGVFPDIDRSNGVWAR
jgi:hypothetical protein